MICVNIAFQASIRPILTINAFETCIQALIGLENFGGFILAVVSSFFRPIIMGKRGISWLLFLFGFLSLLGVFT